jgi:hypothetical protein
MCEKLPAYWRKLLDEFSPCYSNFDINKPVNLHNPPEDRLPEVRPHRRRGLGDLHGVFLRRRDV